ncbi:MAG: lysoplasmalogenase [Cyclobacteriaceae bacterium]|nr:lysoplasmalogenase [Cyclobacteriaceae bacterium]
MDKHRLTSVSLYAFFTVSIINLLNQVVHILWVDLLTKPLLMVTLLLYYLAARKVEFSRIAIFMIAALVFSWFGDVLLMLQGRLEGMFIAGLASFLIAHLFYLVVYQQARHTVVLGSYSLFITTRTVFLLLVGFALIYMLYPSLGSLGIPVMIYTAVIISMALAALIRRGRTTEKSFISVYSGALLFIMSDAMLAINKFLDPLVQADLLVMSTYIAAQFLIVKGILFHEHAPAEADAQKGA